jgi:hypothetical protein
MMNNQNYEEQSDTPDNTGIAEENNATANHPTKKPDLFAKKAP